MADDTMASIAVEFFADASALDAGMAAIVAASQQYGMRAGVAFGSGFTNRAQRLISGLDSMFGSARRWLDLLNQASGSGVAAEYGYLRRQLQGITGDAAMATRYFEQLRRLAADTNYDLSDVFNLTVKIGGRTGDIRQAIADTQDVVDAATAMGVRNEVFERFQINLGQTLSKGDRKPSVVDIQQFQNYAPQLITAIARASRIGVQEASKRIYQASGRELYDMILRVGQQNRGAASRAAGEDPQSVIRNLMDDLRGGIEPTGRLINYALVPPLMALRRVAGDVGELNRATGGVAGFLAVVGGGYLVVNRLTTGVSSAIATTNRLADAMNRYAANGNRAATVLYPGGNIGAPNGGSADKVGRAQNIIDALALVVGLGGSYAASRIDPNNAQAADSNTQIFRRFLERTSAGVSLGVSAGSRFGPLGALAGGLTGIAYGSGLAEKELIDRTFGAGTTLQGLSQILPFLQGVPGFGSFAPAAGFAAQYLGSKEAAASTGGEDLKAPPVYGSKEWLEEIARNTGKTVEEISKMKFAGVGGGQRFADSIQSLGAETAYHLLYASQTGLG